MITISKTKKPHFLKKALSRIIPKPSKEILEEEEKKYDQNAPILKHFLIAIFTVVLTGSFTVSVLAGNLGQNTNSSFLSMYQLSVLVSTMSQTIATNYSDGSRKFANETLTGENAKYWAFDYLSATSTSTSDFTWDSAEPKDWQYAANIVGMSDPSVLTGVSLTENGKQASGIATGNANNENTYPFDVLVSLFCTNDNKSMGARLQKYWCIGRVFQDSGIREYATANTDTSNSMRPLIGYVTYFLYVACMSANSVFSTCLKVASGFDIIGAFKAAGQIASDPSYQYAGEQTMIGDGLIGGQALIGVILQSDFLKEIATDYYYMEGALKFFIFGVYIVAFITSVVLLKPLTYNASLENKKRGRDLAVRVIIMFIGLPLVMLIYHATMSLAVGSTYSPGYMAADGSNNVNVNGTSVGDFSGSGTIDTKVLSEQTINKYVLSVFCNYDDVINNGYYAKLPNGDMTLTYHYNNGELTIDGVDETKLMTYVYCLNGIQGTSPLDMSAIGGASSSISDSLMHDYSIGGLYEGNSGMSTGTVTQPKTLSSESIRAMLIRYADGEKISAGKYDSDLMDYQVAQSTEIGSLISSAAGSTEEGESEMAKFTMSAFSTNLSGLLGRSAQEVAALDSSSTQITPHVTWDTSISTSQMGYLGFIGIPIKVNDTELSEPLYAPILKPTPNDCVFTIKMVGNNSLSGSSINSGADYVRARASSMLVTNGTGMELTIKSSTGNVGDDHNYLGLSPLGMYNMYYTEFTDTGFTVYNPQLTSNNSVGLQLYAVSILGDGFKELVHVLYLNGILIAFAVIGWVLGFTTLANIIVESIKMIPNVFKMIFGSINGFGNALAIVCTLAVEVATTLLIYHYSIMILDLGIKVVGIVLYGIDHFVTNAGAGSQTANSIASVINSIGELGVAAALLYMSFLIIKWRKVLITWFKSLITAVLNKLFQGAGIKAPEGAEESGMMGKLAMAGAGLAIAGGMAGDGTLDGVINDMNNSKLGDAFKDNYEQFTKDIGTDLANGDLGSAIDKLKGMGSVGGLNAMTSGFKRGTKGEDGKVRDDWGNEIAGAVDVDDKGRALDANGNLIKDDNGMLGGAGLMSGVGDRGVNENEFAESQLEDGTDELDGGAEDSTGSAVASSVPHQEGLPLNADGFTDEQQAQIDEAEANGMPKVADDLRKQFEEENFGHGAFWDTASSRARNYRNAYSAGKIQSAADSANYTSGGTAAVAAGQFTESDGSLTSAGQNYLTADEQAAYNSADPSTAEGMGVRQTMETRAQDRIAMAQNGGMTSDQVAIVNDMADSGASSQQIAQQIQTFQAQNYGSVGAAQQIMAQTGNVGAQTMTFGNAKTGTQVTVTQDFTGDAMTVQTANGTGQYQYVADINSSMNSADTSYMMQNYGGNVGADAAQFAGYNSTPTLVPTADGGNAVSYAAPQSSGGYSMPAQSSGGYNMPAQSSGGSSYAASQPASGGGYNAPAAAAPAAQPSYTYSFEQAQQGSGYYNNLGSQRMSFMGGNGGSGSGSSSGSGAGGYNGSEMRSIETYSSDVQSMIQSNGIDANGDGMLDAGEQSKLNDLFGAMNS